MEEDIENDIPVHNLQLSQNSAEVRVKTVRKDEEGYTETKILRLKTIWLKETTFSKPADRAKLIESIICLAVEDLLQATVSQDCWRAFHRVYFRRALIYGKIVVQNIFSKEKKTCYKMSIDDGSEVIDGIMHVSKESKVEVSNFAGRLTTEKNKLKRKEEVGVNIRGKFYPPESKECQNVLESCKILNDMTAKNIIEKNRNFEQGPLKQKCLVFVNLFTNNKNKKNELNIIDIYPNDKIELAWKRQLNKLYMKTYLKSA